MSTTQIPGQPTDTQSKLNDFIFHPDLFHTDAVPRQLPPGEVAEFIRTRVTAAVELLPMMQTEKVIDYYDLQSVADHIKALIAGLAADPSRLRLSAIATRALAIVGSPADVKFAASVYQHLASLPAKLEEFQELLLLYDALNGAAPVEPLASRADSVIASMRKQENRPYEVEQEMLRLDEFRRITLPRAEKAQQVKAQVLQIADRHRRITEEIRVYLGEQYGYLEYLQPWSARRLRREAWGPEPASQTVPAWNPALVPNLVQAFEEALANHQDPTMQVRCLRAIAFFGGTLTDEQEHFLQANAGNQIDRLSR